MITLKQKRYCLKSYRVTVVKPPLNVRKGKKHYAIKRETPIGVGASLSNQLSVQGEGDIET